MREHLLALGFALHFFGALVHWFLFADFAKDPDFQKDCDRDEALAKLPSELVHVVLTVCQLVASLFWEARYYYSVKRVVYPRYRLVRLNGAWTYVRWYIWERPFVYWLYPRYRLLRLRAGRVFR